MTRARRHYRNRLKKHRRIMGYSQTQVAYLLGHKTTGNISKWEHGKMLPSVENLLKLAYVYHTLADELYSDLSHDLRKPLKAKEARLRAGVRKQK